MARFYGEVDGRRASVHRLHGGPMRVRACSWEGGIETTLYGREEDPGGIRCRIRTIPWEGRGKSVLLYDGSLADMFEATPAKPLFAANDHD